MLWLVLQCFAATAFIVAVFYLLWQLAQEFGQ